MKDGGKICESCSESWKTINGLYCCKLTRYVTYASETQLKNMKCPKVSE